VQPASNHNSYRGGIFLKKILITGSSGYIGRFLYGEFKKSGYEVIGIDKNKSKFTNRIVDLTKPSEFISELTRYQPNVIIHCAAIKDIEFCEKNKELAWETNVGSCNSIVYYLKKYKHCKGILVSSDIVFDGKRGNYLEIDLPNPINWYGTTKLHGELLFKQLENFAICRTSLVIGGAINPIERLQLQKEINNRKLKTQSFFSQYIYNLLVLGVVVKVPDNIIASPTHLLLIAKGLEVIINYDRRGVFHLSGAEAVSRFVLAKKIAQYHKMSDENIAIENEVSSSLRPHNVSFDVKATYQELGINESLWKIDEIFKYINWGVM